MRVLALDPGEKVGWARADITEDGAWWSDLRHGITPLRDMALAVYNALIEHDYDPVSACVVTYPSEYDLIVCEDFRLSQVGAKTSIGSTLPTVQFIGMVRLCCWVSGVELVMQSPKIKTTADKTMKGLRPKLYATATRPVAHDAGHDQDALRHLWHWYWLNYVGKEVAA